MKKLFAFVAVALFSVATFASREVVPSDDDLASYATGTYTMCIYNDGACNDIVLNGTFSAATLGGGEVGLPLLLICINLWL